MAFFTMLLLILMTAGLARGLGRSGLRWAAAVGWCSLPFYNYWVIAGCPGDCGIRVDLLVILPLLAVLGMVALWGMGADWLKSRSRRQ